MALLGKKDKNEEKETDKKAKQPKQPKKKKTAAEKEAEKKAREVAKKLSYLNKVEINFVSDRHEKENTTQIIMILVFVLLLGVFVKFAIFDQIAAVNKLQQEYDAKEVERDGYVKQLESYKDILTEYDDITNAFFDDNEKEYIDRMQIIQMIEEDIIAYVDVQSITINKNVARVSTAALTISDVSKITHILLSDSRNSYATTRTTKVDSDTDLEDKVTAEFEIGYWGEPPNAEN